MCVWLSATMGCKSIEKIINLLNSEFINSNKSISNQTHLVDIIRIMVKL